MLANRTTRPRVTCSVSASVSGRAGPARVQTETHSTVTRSFPPHVNVTRHKPPPPEPQHRHGRPPTPAPRAAVTPPLPVFVLARRKRTKPGRRAPRGRVARHWPANPPAPLPSPTPHHHTRRPRRNAARGRGRADRQRGGGGGQDSGGPRVWLAGGTSQEEHRARVPSLAHPHSRPRS